MSQKIELFEQKAAYHLFSPFFSVSILNVLVEWIALLLRIWVVPDSNLGPETGRADRSFVVFLSPQANDEMVPKIRPRLPPSAAFPIHYSLLNLP
jgi:hypothetical protein